MPLQGMLNRRVHPNSTPEDRAFSDEYYAIYRLLPSSSTMESIASRLHIHKSTLSKHISGSRRPDENSVRQLYALAYQSRSSLGKGMPCTIEELLDLLKAAVASRSGQHRRPPVPRQLAAGTSVFPPVLQEQADRHTSAEVWEGTTTVEELQKAGQLQSMHLLLTETGRNAPQEVVCTAAASLRLRGLGDAADTLLLAAGQRPDSDRTAILAALNRGRRFQDLDAVLRGAEYLLGAAA